MRLTPIYIPCRMIHSDPMDGLFTVGFRSSYEAETCIQQDIKEWWPELSRSDYKIVCVSLVQDDRLETVDA